MASDQMIIVGKGVRFGKLTLVNVATSVGGHQQWNCVCDCGRLKPVRLEHLRSLAVVSCGCARADRAMKRSRKLAEESFPTGSTVGRLTVVAWGLREGSDGRRRSFYCCTCACGAAVEVDKHNLGRSTLSCGCLHKERAREAGAKKGSPVRAGMRFGRLTVLSLSTEPRATAQRVWRCLCDCGQPKDATTACLNIGNVKSCGCLSADISRSTPAIRSRIDFVGPHKPRKLTARSPHRRKSSLAQTRKWRSEHRDLFNALSAKYQKREIDWLSDRYVKRVIAQSIGKGTPSSVVSQAIVDAKRAHLRLKRLIREKRNGDD